MCETCKDIKQMEYVAEHPQEVLNSQIVKDQDGNFHIWEGGWEEYYSGTTEKFCDINYCPRCGRKLNEG